MNILAKTSLYWVIDKPAGVTVHNESPSLKDSLDPLLSNYHFLNRLDRETSGLVLVSLDDHHQKMQEAWQKEQTRKVYFALHRSHRAEQKPLQDWKEPLTDKSEGHKNPQGLSAQRLPCHSRFHLLDQNKYFILSAIEIMTGRQHQIRKHAALHNLELIGDTRYGEAKFQKKLATIYPDFRLMLHCGQIELAIENKSMLTSKLPPEFEALFPGATDKAQSFLDHTMSLKN